MNTRDLIATEVCHLKSIVIQPWHNCFLCWMQLSIDIAIACKWHDQAERTCPHREAFESEPLAKQAAVLAWPMASRPTFLWQAMRLVSRHLFIVARAAARLPIYRVFIAIYATSCAPTPFLCPFFLFFCHFIQHHLISFNLKRLLFLSQVYKSCDRRKNAQVKLHFYFILSKCFAILYMEIISLI